MESFLNSFNEGLKEHFRGIVGADFVESFLEFLE